jgi:arylsulfatase A-like enzyme
MTDETWVLKRAGAGDGSGQARQAGPVGKPGFRAAPRRGAAAAAVLRRCGLVLLLALAVRPAAAADRPNLVVVLVDDLGWTDLGTMGSRFYQTPVLDRLAAEGLKFTACYAQPSSAASRAALLTGQEPHRTGMYADGTLAPGREDDRRLLPPENVPRLPPGLRTLGDALAAAGYATGYFGKWALGDDAAGHPGRRGFGAALVTAGPHFNYQTSPPRRVPKGHYLADFLTDEAIQFVDAHAHGPFFVCLAHVAVQAPHEAKAPLFRKYEGRPPAGGHYSAVYAAMIGSVDQNLGRLLQRLDRLGLTDDTLVLFVSDNGGVGGYRSSEPGARRNGITDNAPLRGGQGQLHEGGLRVPCLVRWPGVVPPGRTNDSPVTLADWFPTLLEAAGAAPPDQPCDGRSLLPLLRDPAAAPVHETLAWHFPGYLTSYVRDRGFRATPAGALRRGDLKLIEWFEDGRAELYDLAADLSETNNLAAARPDLVKQLRAELAAWREVHHAVMPRRRSVQ